MMIRLINYKKVNEAFFFLKSQYNLFCVCSVDELSHEISRLALAYRKIR